MLKLQLVNFFLDFTIVEVTYFRQRIRLSRVEPLADNRRCASSAIERGGEARSAHASEAQERAPWKFPHPPHPFSGMTLAPGCVSQ